MYPKIIIFSCNWDGWSCIENAANNGLSYPSSVNAVRVSCLSRIHVGLILKAFELGADGVMLLGCEPGKCHYGSDSDCISQEYEKACSVLGLLGIKKDRLSLVHLSAYEGEQFVRQLKGFIANISKAAGTRHVKKVKSRSA